MHFGAGFNPAVRCGVRQKSDGKALKPKPFIYEATSSSETQDLASIRAGKGLLVQVKAKVMDPELVIRAIVFILSDISAKQYVAV